MGLIKSLIKNSLGVFIAMWVLAEDVFWSVCERLMAFVVRWEWLKVLEKKIASFGPYTALAMFLIPGLVLIPFKLSGVFLMGHGHYVLGLIMFLLAKLAGTAIGARLFVILKPSLMKLPWFAKYFTKFIDWKTRVIVFAKSSYAYRVVVVYKKLARKMLAKMFSGVNG